MLPPVIIITGPVGHGKTTAREIIAGLTHLKGGSCSDVIYAILAHRRQVSVESLRQLPKEEIRPTLIEVGDFVCGGIGEIKEAPAKDIDDTLYRHPSALIRTLYLNGYNVIDGVRRRLELQHARAHLDWNGVRSVVIHVSDPRKPVIQDNSEDLRDLADNLLENDGTVNDLEIKLRAVLEQHFPNALPKAPEPVAPAAPADPEPAPAADTPAVASTPEAAVSP